MSDGFHESAETDVTVVTGELANVVDGAAGATVPATLALTLGSSAGFGAFTPGVAKDYEASTSANVISTAGDAALTRGRPGARHAGPAGERRVLARPAGAGGGVRARSRRSAPRPLTLHTYSGPVSNDPLTIRFKQTIGASEPLRTGAYSKTLTFTLSTTSP